MKNIVIVAHKFLTQPDNEMVDFLKTNNFSNVMHICHSFSSAQDRCSYFVWYKNGEFYKEQKTFDYKRCPDEIIYLKEIYFTLKWVFQSKIIWDKYIGMDGFCASLGNILRFFRKVDKTIFWAMDFVPQQRFKSKIRNKIYHWVNIQGYKRSDEMWDISHRMAEAREKFLGIKKSDYRFHKVVPYGAWGGKIKKFAYQECEKHTLVFMGHLLEKQGAQIIVAAIPEIIKVMPDFKFKIVGDGPYKDELVKIAKNLGVLKYCNFKGKIKDHRELENEIAKSCLAIAPYIKSLDTWTYYADPGKIKTYLACGVPVLLTDIPWNAEEIEKTKCGKIISEEKSDIIAKILEFMREDKNQEYRDNAIEYSRRFDYEKIFNDLIL